MRRIQQLVSRDRAWFRPLEHHIRPLGANDERELSALSAGVAHARANPDFPMHSQVEDGAPRGAVQNGGPFAATGTHLDSHTESIAPNVKHEDPGVISMYEELGFHRHAAYWDAYADA